MEFGKSTAAEKYKNRVWFVKIWCFGPMQDELEIQMCLTYCHMMISEQESWTRQGALFAFIANFFFNGH